MLAGLTNQTVGLLEVEDIFGSPNRRRKGSAPHKSKHQFPYINIADAIEPINLTHKHFEGEDQQFKALHESSSPPSSCNNHSGFSAYRERVDFNRNPYLLTEANAKLSALCAFPLASRRCHYISPTECAISGGKPDSGPELKLRTPNFFHEVGQFSRFFIPNTLSGLVGKSAPALKGNSNVLQLLNYCVEQIPLPPLGSDCHGFLNSLYSYTMLQAINFQKSVLRYLTELSEKTQFQPSAPQDSWTMNFLERSFQQNFSDKFAPGMTRNSSTEDMSPSNESTANDNDTAIAIDLRVRPANPSPDVCPMNFGLSPLPHEAGSKDETTNSSDANRISGLLTHAFNRRLPCFPNYSNELCPPFTPRHFISRFAMKTPTRCLNGRRLKTNPFKNKKARNNVGNLTPSAEIFGRDSCNLHSKKTSFRGTSEEENEVCPHFKPVEQDVSTFFTNIMLDYELT
uniref:Fork-head domain-containing protein n=1 Tax=Mesocestoides corti TaxID=53468 RepID=A0A5K3EJG9_MESCO